MAELDWGALERVATSVYRSARCRSDEAARPIDLARALLGAAPIVVVPQRLLPGDGALVRVREQWRIYLPRGLRPEFARFAVLHELSHFVLGRAASEADCDALAACLLAPRAAFVKALSESEQLAPRERYHHLATWFRCTDSFAALREGEVTEEPLVVVAPASVRIRGRSYSWPAEPELRGLARARNLPGLAKAVLRDDPRRVAIRVG